MAANRHRRLTLVAVGALGLLAGLQGWLGDRRPEPPERRTANVMEVTSGADGGPGTLREAIFAADRARERARVLIRVRRIALATPLPPLINPHGVVVEGVRGGAEIDAAALAGAPALDVAAPGSTLHGLTVRNAAAAGVLVRAAGVRLTSLVVAGCAVGVLAAEGATDLVVEASAFEGNEVGFKMAPGGRATAVRGSRFEDHGEAAVWAVGGDPAERRAASLEVSDNRFSGDRISLLLGASTTATGNDLADAGEAAVFLLGGGAAVRGNRIRGGRGIGVYVRDADGASIADNEIDHLAGVGVVVHSSRNTVVRDNRIVSGGYGIAHVFGDPGRPDLIADNLVLDHRLDGLFVVGGSPVVRGNRLVANRGAGIRILDFVPVEGTPTPSRPLVEANDLEQNGADAPQRGEYRERPVDGEGGEG